MRSVFVTGTDTGAGKTLASCTLLHALCARGHRAVGVHDALVSSQAKKPAVTISRKYPAQSEICAAVTGMAPV